MSKFSAVTWSVNLLFTNIGLSVICIFDLSVDFFFVVKGRSYRCGSNTPIGDPHLCGCVRVDLDSRNNGLAVSGRGQKNDYAAWPREFFKVGKK